jgi:hypothetical protein
MDAIQRVEADAASRDAARFDVRGSVRQNLSRAVEATDTSVTDVGGAGR